MAALAGVLDVRLDRPRASATPAPAPRWADPRRRAGRSRASALQATARNHVPLAPMPCETKDSTAGLAVILGSFCRSDPAAALRGLENERLAGFDHRPASCISDEGGDGEVHLAADLPQHVERGPVSARPPPLDPVDGTLCSARTLVVTSSPTRPSPRVSAQKRRDVLCGTPDRAPARRTSTRTGIHAPQSASRLVRRPARLFQAHRVPRTRMRCPGSASAPGDAPRRSRRQPLRPRSGSASRACAARGTPPRAPASRRSRRVEVGVGQRRVVEHVVAPARVLDLLGERRRCSLPRLGATRSTPARSRTSLMGHILPCRTHSRATPRPTPVLETRFTRS